jgi:hypothetical protein
LFRGHLGAAVDIDTEGEGRPGDGGPIRFPHHGAEREVGALHPKAMPVILTTAKEVDLWMTAPAAEALTLQRPLPDGTLRIVARGTKEDVGARAAEGQVTVL